MKVKLTGAIRYTILAALLLTFVSGCVYYNTMYHARRWFNEAESLRERGKRDLAAGQEINLYRDAIVKSSGVLAEHPTSSWVDDALFIIGKSFYHLEENARAERKFRELLSSFPESEYATESRFYLGKSSYRLENYELARQTFTEFMEQGSQKEWRAEATYLMGEISAAEGDTSRAVDYFNQYLAEYPGSPQQQEVQYKVGQLQFELGNYANAVTAFEKAAEGYEEPLKRFNAYYDQGRAYYRLDSIDAGLAVYQMLEDEQQDSVKLGEILLRKAEGFKLKGTYNSERRAILLYDEIGNEFAQRQEAAEAWYQIGAICQDDWGDLELAKEYFDLAARVPRGSDFKTLAIERAAEITKVETFRAMLNSESEEEACRSRFRLAELYRTTLNNPDSALSEYKGVVRTFPESGYAPKALLNIGYLYDTHLEDPETASTYYAQVVEDYPRSDAVYSALQLLGDEGVEPDVIYPAKLYEMAETQWQEEGDLDSALGLYQKFVEEFPESELTPRADFAAAKIKLAQFVPADPPPTENPYRVADSLLTLEAARDDSIATTEADSVAADTTATPPPVARSESDSMVTRIFSGDSTIVEATDATGDEIRLTDFIGGGVDKEAAAEKGTVQDSPPAQPMKGTLPEGAVAEVPKGVPVSDSLRAAMLDSAATADTTVAIEAESGAVDAHPTGVLDVPPPAVDTSSTSPDSVVQKGNLPESEPTTVTPPRDRKRISLDQFPGQQQQGSDTTAVSAAATPVFGASEGSDSLAAEIGDTTFVSDIPADSAAVDSVEVVVVDSSMIWLFQHLAKKYDGTEIGDEANRLAKGATVQKQKRQIQQPPPQQLPVTQTLDTAQAAIDSAGSIYSFQDTTSSAGFLEDALREEIDKWPLMQDEPITIPEFDYPVEAASSKFEGRVTLKVKIDFDGRVTEVNLLKGTNVPLLDREVENVFLETYFDPLKIEPLHLGSYFIYYYEIVLPEVYR